MNPAGNPHKGIKPLQAPSKMKSPFNGGGVEGGDGGGSSSNQNSPRKSKTKNVASEILQKQLRKRLKNTFYGHKTPRFLDADLSPRSEDPSPRGGNTNTSADNTPRQQHLAGEMNRLVGEMNNLSPHQYSNNMHPFSNGNSPRNSKQTFWNFNVPTELNNGNKKTHVTSIPQNKNSMAAIYSVQKYNKPLPAITIKC